MDGHNRTAYRLDRTDAGLLCTALAMLGLFIFMPEPAEPRLPSGLDSLQPAAKKQAFFEFLRPVVEQANDAVRRDRARLEAIEEKLEHGAPLSWFDRSTFETLAAKYEVEIGDESTDEQIIAELGSRIGIVPPALALVQAAKESGWGTSRFAVEGNNLYGQRCYEAGCGIAPKGRPNAQFGVARFDSVVGSVRSYIRNLNTHPQYAQFRELRDEMREAGERLTGMKLADGLSEYSERGQEYVSEIRALISQNGLEAAR